MEEIAELRNSKFFNFKEATIRAVGPFYVRMGTLKYVVKDATETRIRKQAVIIKWPLTPEDDGDLVLEFLLNDGSVEKVLETEKEKEFDKLQAMIHSVIYHTMNCKDVLGLMERVWEAGIAHGKKERSMEFLTLLFDGKEAHFEALFDWWRSGG